MGRIVVMDKDCRLTLPERLSANGAADAIPKGGLGRKHRFVGQDEFGLGIRICIAEFERAWFVIWLHGHGHLQKAEAFRSG